MTQRISISNNKGFTLVELMVAILIMLVGLLGLLKSVNVVMEQNLKNVQRDEGVRVANRYMEHFRAQPFSEISTCSACTGGIYHYATIIIPSQTRGGKFPYYVQRTTAISSDQSAVVYDVRVAWTYKNATSAHSIRSARGKNPGE